MPLWRLNPADMVKRMTYLDGVLDLQTRITGRDIEREVEIKTTPYVPLRRGWLERSYRSVTKSSHPLHVEFTYSAKSKKGYDYAAIQHEKPFNHPRRGTDHYLTKGLTDARPIEIWAKNLLRIL